MEKARESSNTAPPGHCEPGPQGGGRGAEPPPLIGRAALRAWSQQDQSTSGRRGGRGLSPRKWYSPNPSPLAGPLPAPARAQAGPREGCPPRCLIRRRPCGVGGGVAPAPSRLRSVHRLPADAPPPLGMTFVRRPPPAPRAVFRRSRWRPSTGRGCCGARRGARGAGGSSSARGKKRAKFADGVPAVSMATASGSGAGM